VDIGVAIYLRLEAWRGLQALGETEHVDGPVHAGLGCLHGIMLVVDGRGRAREIVNLVHLHIEWESDIVSDHLEVFVLEQVVDIATGASQTEEYWGHVNPVGARSCYDEGKRCAETLFFDYWRQHRLRIKVARIFNTSSYKLD
jgi:hypothetical protein